MADVSKATPRPWVIPNAPWWIRQAANVSGPGIADCFMREGRTQDECDANAALIVKAVNLHDELIAALRGITERYVQLAGSGDCGFWNPEEEDQVIAARAALAKTEASDA